MGFLDTAWNITKNIGVSVANQIEKSANEIPKIKPRNESKSDEELIRRYHYVM